MALLAHTYLPTTHVFVRLLVCGAVLTVAYLTIMQLLGVLTDAERQSILERISRLRNLFKARPATLVAPATPGEATRPLRAREVLRRGSRRPAQGPRAPRLPIRWGEPLIEVRAHRGPQWRFFASPEDFFDCEYRVSPNSDRRGLRLRGPALALARRSDIPPEGTAPGAVQVPGDGMPIVLGPDRPVTGGYAKIATVVPVDFPLLAQARPGTAVRFVEERWT